MKKILLIFVVALCVLFGIIAAGGTGKDIPPDQPEISNAKIIMDFRNKVMEVSFQYEKVAGNIDKSRIAIVIWTFQANGLRKRFIIGLNPVGSEEKEGEDGISPDTVTQGRSMFFTIIPDYVEIMASDEVIGATIVVTDCLGRSASHHLEAYSETQNKIGI